MGTSKRQQLGDSEGAYKPSPSLYNPNESFTKTHAAAWGFGSGLRPSITTNGKNETPGPLAYNIPSKTVEGPAYHMGLKTIDLISPNKNYVPGPG